MIRTLLAVAGALVFAGALAARAEVAGAPFTQAQADQGAQLYLDHCVSCHGAHLDDGEFGPSLKGGRFKRKWSGHPVKELYDFVSTSMPPGQGGALDADEYAALIAYVLQANGSAAGPAPLPSDAQALGGLTTPG